jgi:hypothetical protein
MNAQVGDILPMGVISGQVLGAYEHHPGSAHAHEVKLHKDNQHVDRHNMHSYTPVPVIYIFLYTTLMAAASGLGAVPFFIFGRLQQYWAGIANAVAVGVMLSASFDLLKEGAPYSPFLTISGMIIGALFIKASQDFLSRV